MTGYNKYRRKRNIILFLLIIITFIIISSLLFFFINENIDFDLLFLIYFPLILGNFILVIFTAPKIKYYTMYSNYLSFFIDENEVLKTVNELFTQEWMEDLLKRGYIVSHDYVSNTILYKYNKKLDDIDHSTDTLVFINIAKNSNYDFYSSNVDDLIQSVYINNKNFQNIKNQITLQFKSYDKMDDNVKKDVESIILYKEGKHVRINLNVAYLKNTKSIYTIFPTKVIPNKYVYFACEEIKRISYIMR